MSPDAPVIYYLIVATTAVAGALTLWERHETTSHRPALLWWAVGYFMIASGCFVRIRPELPHEVVVGLSNVLIAWGYAAIAVGVHRFVARPVPLVAQVAVVAATIGWVLVGQYHSLGLRVVTTSIASGTMCALAVLALGSSAARGERAPRAQRLAHLLLTLHGGFFFARAGVTAIQIDSVTYWGATMTATMFEGIVWSFAGPATLLAMVREQRESRHREASATDFLTGLDNRRAFFDKGEALLSREPSVALLVFDLDHFKRINDTYGHGIGDEMLALFSRLAEREMRGVDILARLGGEEFAALLPGLDQGEAEAVARRVARSLEAARLEREGAPAVRTTVSVGVALSLPGVPTDLGAMLAAADRALYRAKREGRNRIEHALPLAA